jgi:MPBQ/MSBQ methyltransferase
MAANHHRRSLVSHVYDSAMYLPLHNRLYQESDFCNFGYWDAHTRDPRDACENLERKLLSFFPDFRGAILDVGCGKGATTGFLLRHFPASRITGINISGKQLATCRGNVPECTFAAMDATCLGFAAESFDKIICVEAAFHFDTRKEFLKEARRVLRKGGQIVLSDILFPRWVHRRDRMVPAANYVEDPDAYRRLYQESGFENVEVADCTAETWKSFHAYAARWAWRHRRLRAMSYFAAARMVVQRYLLVSARKPSG